MISTLLILTLLMGFIVVEKNTRKIGFADVDPWFVYKSSYEEGHYFKIKFMQHSFFMDLSPIYGTTDVILERVIQIMNDLKIGKK